MRGRDHVDLGGGVSGGVLGRSLLLTETAEYSAWLKKCWQYSVTPRNKLYTINIR
jgi:hypothetical protein